MKSRIVWIPASASNVGGVSGAIVVEVVGALVAELAEEMTLAPRMDGSVEVAKGGVIGVVGVGGTSKPGSGATIAKPSILVSTPRAPGCTRSLRPHAERTTASAMARRRQGCSLGVGVPIRMYRHSAFKGVGPKEMRLGRNPALDGLRAIAIVMVVGYHLDKSILPAGHWGVVVFFVLSGYLITNSLCAEVDRRGQIDLGPFYLKRGLRLVPALLAMCAVMLAVGTQWSQVIPALGFSANYARIGGVDLGVMTHTWFVAVIIHFYLVWPLVIGWLPARHRRRVIGGLALAAIAWRLVAIGVMSPGWVYNATDTNAAALLVGGYLAVAKPSVPRWAGSALPAMLALMFLPVFGDAGSAVLWGGFVALVLGALVVQHTTTRPTWMAHPALLRLAELSFGLYLWHYVLLRSDIPLWSALVLTVLATLASWYLVEQPVQRWLDRRHAPNRALRPAASA